MQNIKQIHFEEIKERIAASNPMLAKEIALIPAASLPPLYLASYSFGALLIEDGLTYIPFEGKLVSTENASLPPEIREDLGYAKIPLMMPLNKTSEIFLDLNQRTYPIHFFQPGKIFGLWPILDSNILGAPYNRGMWNLALGARTLFMLPKIMDYSSHSKMQRQLLLEEAYPPHNLFDQGPVFANIASSPKMACDWECEVLFFGKAWTTLLKTPEYQKLHHVLLQQEWDETLFLRNHMGLEIIWQVLAQVQANTRIKPNAYVIDTVKHLIDIAANVAPGFAPLSLTDETIAPVATIQNAYLEYYQLKQYIPTLFAPAYLKDRSCLYYSFLCPTLLSLSPKHNFRNTLEDERNIKNILSLFQNELSLYEGHQRVLPTDIQFDFFHFESDPLYTIFPVDSLPSQDPALSTFPPNIDLVFSENAPFLRSCVRIHQP